MALTLFQNLVRKITGALGNTPDVQREQQLLELHRDRCLNFRMLLSSNNRALETMAAVEDALSGNRLFGMEFVRRACTDISSDVYRMVKALTLIAPGKYEKLYDRHERLVQNVESAISPAEDSVPGLNVLPFEAIQLGDLQETGSKAATLGELSVVPGVRTLAGFVVTASGFHRFTTHKGLREELERRIQAAGNCELSRLYSLSSSLQQLVVTAPVPDDLAADIIAAVKTLGAGRNEEFRLAVRSSAVGEDMPGLSFAGQFRSELNVHPDSVLDAYRDVVASFYSATAISYRLSHGLRDEDTPMCVAVMPMVKSSCGGVVYSRNPLDPDDGRMLLSAVHGLPKGIVDGSETGQTWRVARNGGESLRIVERSQLQQEMRYAPADGEGLERFELTQGQRDLPVLDDDEVLQLARLTLRIEQHLVGPQDIEWCKDASGEFIILQARPLTLDSNSGSGRSGGSGGSKVSEEQDDDTHFLITCGVTGSPGVANGPVHIVKSQADALSFPDGGVLVATQALPEWAALLPRAAALICERGGVTGHLATVSREYGIPALFLCQGATGVLRQKAWVTVDADARIVLPGRLQPRHSAPPRQPLKMQGTPVHLALGRAARLIVPLNLLDPNADSFSPEGCETFHDITRFCHEQAVKEMFSPDGGLPLPTAVAKRLVCDVPMQYWIIDLGDGFFEPVSGTTVRLEQIANRSLFALWDGLTAKPWAGPPPVDARGFMSVLSQAASNPELEAGAQSSFTQRNYFMLSKTFCSLQCRFGFHFCTVEAEVDADDSGNYVSFRFTGGAADRTRRELRARMIADLLAERGFRTDLTGDTLCARIENIDPLEACDLLRILGHLITHTRQLDMVMANPAEFQRRSQQIRSDIELLFPMTNAFAQTDVETGVTTS